MVEFFWARMKTELLDSRKWRTRTELSTEIFGWIEVFYTGPGGTAVLGCSLPSPMRSSMPTTPALPDSRNLGPRSGGQIRWTTIRGPRQARWGTHSTAPGEPNFAMG